MYSVWQMCISQGPRHKAKNNDLIFASSVEVVGHFPHFISGVHPKRWGIFSINGEEECDISGNMHITYFAGNEWRHHYVRRQALALVHFRNLVDYRSETMYWRMPSPWNCLSGCQLPKNTSPMRNPEENAQQSHRIGGWHQLRVHWNGITNIGMVHVLSSSLAKFL